MDIGCAHERRDVVPLPEELDAMGNGQTLDRRAKLTLVSHLARSLRAPSHPAHPPGIHAQLRQGIDQ
jgi:hypothetical protein